MKNLRTAPVLLALLFTLIISLCAGLPQAAQAAEPMTIEGTWMITGGPQTGIIANALQQGQRITIRRKGPIEYEVLYSDGQAVRYHGSATEIKFTRTAKFEELKRGIPKPQIPHSGKQPQLECNEQILTSFPPTVVLC